MLLQVAQIIPDTEAEGPGRRFALWVQGCPMRCQECCNPQMLRFEGGEGIEVEELAARALAIEGLEGVSLLGGEPFAQAEGLAQLARLVKEKGLSVMVYTGFTRAELEAKRSNNEPGIGELLDACDLLVDGRFERDLPERERRWIGSTNQVMHFMTDRYSPADPRLRTSNTVEIRLQKGAAPGEPMQLTINGWPALAARTFERMPRR